jgi:FkbM family methyltransferase
MTVLDTVASVLRDAQWELEFTILDIGAREIHENQEPFYRLLSVFPGSRVVAFEPDEALCKTQNASARAGVTYYPQALGRTGESRKFYETEDPMCSSLYRPNSELLDRYNNMEVARLKNVTDVHTVSLDVFCANHEIEQVDFIKIDVQGAELDIFQGGVATLKNVLGIVSEAEFVKNYVDQPLFGEVCSFLDGEDLQFQKILGVGGRTLKPTILNNDPNACSQMLWADVLFFRNLFTEKSIWNEQRLKLAVLAALYDCFDLTYFCFSEVDRKEGESIASELSRRLS